MYYSVYTDGAGIYIVDPEDREVIPECMFSEIIATGGSLAHPVGLIEKYVADEVVEVEVDPDDDPKVYERIAKILGVDEYCIAVYRLEYED